MLDVVTPVFNSLPLVRQTVESVRANTGVSHRHWLIYNHPPDGADTRAYVDDAQRREPERVIILDPGRNIGCHEAVNLGWARAVEKAPDDGRYLCKLDDDVVVPMDWASTLVSALRTEPRLAFVAPDCEARHPSRFTTVGYADGLELEVIEQGTLGFSCLVLPSETYRAFGPLKRLDHRTRAVASDGFYGGEEAYYCSLAVQAGRLYGYCPSVRIIHHDNELRDIGYVLWKYWYGLVGGTTLDFEAWSETPDVRSAYRFWLREQDVEWYREAARRWFLERGEDPDSID